MEEPGVGTDTWILALSALVASGTSGLLLGVGVVFPLGILTAHVGSEGLLMVQILLLLLAPVLGVVGAGLGAGAIARALRADPEAATERLVLYGSGCASLVLAALPLIFGALLVLWVLSAAILFASW